MSKAFEALDVTPIGKATAKKVGGSLRMTIIAEACRELEIEPGDLSVDDEIEFHVSISKEFDDRLVLDLSSEPDR